MSDPTPQTRAEFQAAQESEPITYHAVELPETSIELVGSAPAEFLPLNARRALFIAGIVALFAGPLLAVQMPEYGDALVTGGNMLAAVGLGTALANPTR